MDPSCFWPSPRCLSLAASLLCSPVPGERCYSDRARKWLHNAWGVDAWWGKQRRNYPWLSEGERWRVKREEEGWWWWPEWVGGSWKRGN